MPANFPSASLLDDSAVLELTRNGERELREPGTALDPRHIEALVLIDGHSTVAQVLKRARITPADLLRTSLNELADKGLLRIKQNPGLDVLDAGDFFSLNVQKPDILKSGEQADAEAAANTEFLRRNGYCVNLARRPPDAATPRPMAERGKKQTVLVIDDDPDICALLQMYLKLEGFETRTAGNREEIIAEIRRSPLPDLVMLGASPAVVTLPQTR